MNGRKGMGGKGEGMVAVAPKVTSWIRLCTLYDKSLICFNFFLTLLAAIAPTTLPPYEYAID